jgi:repressor LexA
MDIVPMEADEIRARMDERGMRVSDLANAIGLEPNKVSKALSGTRQFKAAEMLRIVQVLRGPIVSTPARAVRMIPIIGEVAASTWREAVRRPIDEMPAFDSNISANAFGLEIVGDSMNLLAPEGGVAVVDPDDKALYPGRRYVVANAEGETTFKEFVNDPARLVPLSSNPDHREILLGGDDVFTMVGRVSWVARRA